MTENGKKRARNGKNGKKWQKNDLKRFRNWHKTATNGIGWQEFIKRERGGL